MGKYPPHPQSKKKVLLSPEGKKGAIPCGPRRFPKNPEKRFI